MQGRNITRLAGLSAIAAAGLLALPGAAGAAVNVSVDATGKLSVTSDAADPITVTSVAGKVQVNSQAVTGDPNSSSITKIEVYGGPGDNVINLAAVASTDFTALTAVKVYGGEGNDTIQGSQLADDLAGGGGDDRITGDDNAAGTRDRSLGEAGNDTMVWNPGDDDDVNEGGAGDDTVEVNGGNGGEQFEAKPSATAGRVVFDRTGPSPVPGPFNIDIGTAERLDLNANGGDDTYTTASGALAIALDIDGGEGNDSLEGSDGADLLVGGGGNDTITGDDNPAGTRDQSVGGAGDDTMIWNPGDDDDVNEGGDGNDTVQVNGGNGPEQFEVAPSSTPGRVAFDRTGPSPTPGPFSIDIGTSESLVLNANGGDDTIKGRRGLAGLIASTFNGGDDNDRIKGTDAADFLSGGKGLDLIRSRDRAEDQVECDGGFDLALVDRRDRVRACEIVLGGNLRVKHRSGVANVTGGAAALTLRCVSTGRCKGKAALLHKGKSLGKASFKIKGKKSKSVRVKLGRKGQRLMANAPAKGLAVKLRIDARDSAGNGWRTVDRIKLKG